jgi:hypothetical protein
VINVIRPHLAKFGIVAPVGRHGVEELLGIVADPSDTRVPEVARACLAALGAAAGAADVPTRLLDRLSPHVFCGVVRFRGKARLPANLKTLLHRIA